MYCTRADGKQCIRAETTFLELDPYLCPLLCSASGGWRLRVQFIRNPFASMISWFRFNFFRHNFSWGQFRTFWTSQARYEVEWTYGQDPAQIRQAIRNVAADPPADFVVHLETLEHDLQALEKTLCARLRWCFKLPPVPYFNVRFNQDESRLPWPSCRFLRKLWHDPRLLKVAWERHAVEFGIGDYSIVPPPLPEDACTNQSPDTSESRQAIRNVWWARCCLLQRGS